MLTTIVVGTNTISLQLMKRTKNLVRQNPKLEAMQSLPNRLLRSWKTGRIPRFLCHPGSISLIRQFFRSKTSCHSVSRVTTASNNSFLLFEYKLKSTHVFRWKSLSLSHSHETSFGDSISKKINPLAHRKKITHT